MTRMLEMLLTLCYYTGVVAPAGGSGSRKEEG